jgi:hypothetical protein
MGAVRIPHHVDCGDLSVLYFERGRPKFAIGFALPAKTFTAHPADDDGVKMVEQPEKARVHCRRQDLLDRLLDRVDQIISTKRLMQECDRPYRRDLIFDCSVVVATHENNRPFEAVGRQLVRQLHAGDVAEVDIDDEAAGFAA